MLGFERRKKILDVLHTDGKVHVTRISKHLQVTPETIRRDLERLEKEGIVNRSYGGAVLARPTMDDIPFAKRTMTNFNEKKRIAEKTADLITDSSSLLMDSSSTTLSLLSVLDQTKNLTIISNSMQITHEYSASNFRIINTGGELRAHSMALVGVATSRAIKTYNVDYAVISCKGLHRERGVMESNDTEAAVKQLMVQQAKTTILMADSTKFDNIVFANMLDFTSIDYLVTDREPNDAWVEFLDKQGVQLIF